MGNYLPAQPTVVRVAKRLGSGWVAASRFFMKTFEVKIKKPQDDGSFEEQLKRVEEALKMIGLIKPGKVIKEGAHGCVVHDPANKNG